MFHVTAPAHIFLNMQPQCAHSTCFEIFHCLWSRRKLLSSTQLYISIATLVHPNGSAAPDEGTQMQSTQCTQCRVPKLSTVHYFIFIYLFIYFCLSISMLCSLYSCSNKNSVLYIYIYIYIYKLGECRNSKTKRIRGKADAGKCQERKARNKRAQKAGKSNEKYIPCDMESFCWALLRDES